MQYSLDFSVFSPGVSGVYWLVDGCGMTRWIWTTKIRASNYLGTPSPFTHDSAHSIVLPLSHHLLIIIRLVRRPISQRSDIIIYLSIIISLHHHVIIIDAPATSCLTHGTRYRTGQVGQDRQTGIGQRRVICFIVLSLPFLTSVLTVLISSSRFSPSQLSKPAFSSVFWSISHALSYSRAPLRRISKKPTSLSHGMAHKTGQQQKRTE